jgi:hypothetical protein
MGVIDDVRKWLKEIPLWQELEKIPRRTDELEKRVAALEQKLERAPGEVCPKCGAHSMRLTTAGRRLGGGVVSWRFDHGSCTTDGCGYTEERKVNL